MANITKRMNKDGSASYLIRVYVDETNTGFQIVKSMTWKAPINMRPTTAEKEAYKQAALFEDKVKKGLVSFDGKTKFADYASTWLENEPLAYKTKQRYEDLLKRINPAIGHIKLEKLQARHLEEFYRNLTEPGIKNKGKYATSDKLNMIMKEQSLTRLKLSEKAGVSSSTVSSAALGKRISIEKAEKICAALKMDIACVFTVICDTEGLSPKTIHHHHQLISAILEKAKRERIIPYNVAKEHATAPKLIHTEAEYLDDKEAQRFLSLLMLEDDIRVKTALILLLFTGMRRGELCGLSWYDCDLEGCNIRVERASQYQKGKGTVEVSTKNESSIRNIDIPSFVTDILREYKIWWNKQQLLWGKDWQGEKERLFVQESGKPINPDTINYWLRKFIEKHDFQHITPHGLRHTFATLQITAGVDMRTLQARTGHAQASTLVNIYSHSIKSAQKKATDALEAVLLPDTKEG